MMGAVAMVLSSTLLLLWFLDHPYQSGAGGLRPVAMERTLQLLGQEHSRTTGIVVPCDAHGVASRP
jgi:hypothetical protein